MSKIGSCSACYYWTPQVQKNAPTGVGECHRFPPDANRIPINPQESIITTATPIVPRNFWCGEYKPTFAEPTPLKS